MFLFSNRDLESPTGLVFAESIDKAIHKQTV